MNTDMIFQWCFWWHISHKEMTWNEIFCIPPPDKKKIQWCFILCISIFLEHIHYIIKPLYAVHLCSSYPASVLTYTCSPWKDYTIIHGLGIMLVFVWPYLILPHQDRCATDHNYLVPGRSGSNLKKKTIFKIIIQISSLGIYCEIPPLRWMLQNPTNEESTLVQVMAWCCQAPSCFAIGCMSLKYP